MNTPSIFSLFVKTNQHWYYTAKLEGSPAVSAKADCEYNLQLCF